MRSHAGQTGHAAGILLLGRFEALVRILAPWPWASCSWPQLQHLVGWFLGRLDGWYLGSMGGWWINELMNKWVGATKRHHYGGPHCASRIRLLGANLATAQRL